jgi:hypothetical protein
VRQGKTVTDFFISYTGVDRSWAEWIAWQLEAAGYTTVLQAWDFRPGANFVLAMQHAAAASARTIAVLSPAYLQSGFTAAEWAAAFARDPTGTQGLLLPVRIHDCESQGLLPQIVYIDLVGLDAAAARETLLAGVQLQRAKPTRAPEFPGPSPRPVRVPPLFPGASPPALKTGRDVSYMQRNRSQMLEKVRLTWIKGLLEPSLSHLARIELGLETQPDVVERPFDLLVQRPAQAPQALPSGMPIRQIFQDSGHTLLILGQPGAGKTTLLLELTRDLLDCAAQDERHLIPVVFNLSSWAEHRGALTDWLMDELNKRYDVPRKLAKTWVDAELLLPLLDGLDEVALDHREACVETINAFVNEHGLLPLVVCSRVADYEALTMRLRLPSAVIIQSLSRQQIQHYVDQTGVALAGLRTVLQADTTLWEVLDTPLMLSIAALAYQGRSAEEIPSSGSVGEHRSQLWEAYTDAMFHRRAKAAPYSREQTEHWLTWLASAMQDHHQSMFYLEWMQPDWLPKQKQQALVHTIASLMSSLLFGLSAGLCFGLLTGVSFWGFASFSMNRKSTFMDVTVIGVVAGLCLGLLTGWSLGLAVGLLVGLLGGVSSGLLFWLIVSLVGYSQEIQPVEKLQWSWSTAQYRLKHRLWIGLLYVVGVGLFIALSLGLSRGLGVILDFKLMKGGLLTGLGVALLPGLLILLPGLVFGLVVGVLGLVGGLLVGLIKEFTTNEDLKRAGQNSIKSGLVGGLVFGLVFWLFGGLIYGLEDGLLVGLKGVLFGGLLVGLRFGGRAYLHHFALRLVLWHNSLAPLNYVRFLDYAAARIFLRKVGGGYVFVHRMLLEYFADPHQTSITPQK